MTKLPPEKKMSTEGSDASDEEEYFLVGQDSYEATRLLSKDDASRQKLADDKPKYPKVVFFIMANEFCERFSFYGMKAVLILYLTNILFYSEDTSTTIYHIFTMLCYFTPLFGALLSDMYLGKFKTIFYISLIYASGNIILSLSAAPPLGMPQAAFCMVGLTLIGLGTGGIKPCVAAFGGDQFHPSQVKERQQFFSIFYFCINAGSLISIFLTPFLREDFPCFGQTSCFTLAFGVPAALMVVALIFFVIGRPCYKIIPPEGNIIVDVGKCVGHAISRKIRAVWHRLRKRSTPDDHRQHWLDFADDKYNKKLIEEVKGVLRVLFLYIPIPLFWALFDQQGSRWTLQATKMNGKTYLPKWERVKPDQIQVINPFLILILIPIYESIIYPAFGKCKLLVKPLQRMAVGGLLAALSFVVAAVIQLKLEATLPEPPAPGRTDLTVINAIPCKLELTIPATPVFSLNYGESHFKEGISASKSHHILASIKDGGSCTENQATLDFSPSQQLAYTVVCYRDQDGTIQSLQMQPDRRSKPPRGSTDVRFLYLYNNPVLQNANFSVSLKLHNTDPKLMSYIVKLNSSFAMAFSHYQTVDPSEEFEVMLPDPINPSKYRSKPSFTFVSEPGAVYTFLIVEASNNSTKHYRYVTVEENSVSMFWQVPQYVIITMGEVMFSITGLEFSYSQAPESMKSLLQAAWLMTVAFGNVIVVIVTEAEIFDRQSYEFFLFAALMVLDMMIFIIMAYFYKYVDTPKEETEGIPNTGFENDTKM